MIIIKMMEYSQYLRHSYFETFRKLPWDEFAKGRGASFDSLKDIFLHTIEYMHRFLNNSLLGNAELPRINFNDYDSMEKVKNYLDRVESDVNQYLNKVTPEELLKKVNRTFPDGRTVQMTVEDMLIDFFQEDTHHRGEFIALLWQIKIEPPHMGWGKYINR